MRSYVKKLKKYYNSGKIGLTEIQNLLDSEKITQEEYDYIVKSNEDSDI